MPLRMVFDRDDLQRVRVADAPDPMWELVLSLHQARERRSAARHGPWLRQTRRLVHAGGDVSRWFATLFTLVPQKGNFPDFLTPAPRVTELDAGCEAMLCTPDARIQRDLAAAFTGRAAPGWVRDLATGDRGRLHAVVGAMRGVHDLLIAPHWQQVTAAVAADRAARVHALARSGLGALLTSVPGVAGWDGQTLELAYPSTRTVRLAGRGLTLVPSYFCTRAPVTLIDPELPPVLIYPANRGAGRSAVTDGASQRLVALLGRTRADCLAALDTPCTTSGLAARLGTTVGTASKHAAVLRDARLVESRRTGGAVQHHRTRLGEALLLAGGTHEL